ncbi:hypothetical protein CW702_03140 [Candidatus Bathyarchaeota archaeon]|nr:MAG: hypothetical protein CW702_03140 [Candidatus Bathyarchaeota archaeon]
METKDIIIVILLVAVIAIGGAAGYYLTLPPPEPGKLAFSDLSISPTAVEAGHLVTITVVVKNVGGSSITETVPLLINGEVEDSQEVTLDPEESTTLTFTVNKTEVGTYTVVIGGLSGSFDVISLTLKNPNTIIVATIGEAESLDPAWAYDTASGEIIFNVYEPLIWFDRGNTDKFIPLLAENVPSVEDGTITNNGTVYIFKIRKGVNFTGYDAWGNLFTKELTPADVEYSFERAMVQDRSGGPIWMLYEPLLGVMHSRFPNGTIRPDLLNGTLIDQAIESNATHVWFKLKRPYPPFLQILSQTWASIVSKDFCVMHGDWPGTWNNWTLYNDPPRSPLDMYEVMCGTGPYMFKSWKHGVQITLVRNPNYWRGPASVETVIIKKVDEWSTRKLMFMAGDADIVYVPRAHAPEIEGLPGIRCYKNLPTLAVDAIFFNFNISRDSPYVGSGKLDWKRNSI